MKVAHNDETNLNTQLVRQPHVPTIVNMQHFISGSSVRKRETSEKVFPVFGIFKQRTEGGRLQVCYAKDVWQMNGLRIRIRLVVLSNFHVQNIFIRATV